MVFPQSAHGIILSTNSENEMPRMGSVFVIGLHVVLTVAHNAYNSEKLLRKR